MENVKENQPINVYVVETVDWNDESRIEGIFSTEEKAEAFKKSLPDGPWKRYLFEYEVL